MVEPGHGAHGCVARSSILLKMKFYPHVLYIPSILLNSQIDQLYLHSYLYTELPLSNLHCPNSTGCHALPTWRRAPLSTCTESSLKYLLFPNSTGYHATLHLENSSSLHCSVFQLLFWSQQTITAFVQSKKKCHAKHSNTFAGERCSHRLCC